MWIETIFHPVVEVHSWETRLGCQLIGPPLSGNSHDVVFSVKECSKRSAVSMEDLWWTYMQPTRTRSFPSVCL